MSDNFQSSENTVTPIPRGFKKVVLHEPNRGERDLLQERITGRLFEMDGVTLYRIGVNETP